MSTAVSRRAFRRQEIPVFRKRMINRTQRLLANIRELAPGITSRAAEIEAGRRMPPDLVEALRSIGIFRMFVPQSHGGLELDMPAALEIFGALSRMDGSVGWMAMIGGGCDMFASLLQRDTYEQVYQKWPGCDHAQRHDRPGGEFV
jgi:alkylation response protein AidB-like acyl-CoA dehydrogenase